MSKEHTYELQVRWTGNTGSGTSSYRDYDRGHIIQGADKPPIFGSADPAFLGDSSLYNPEELFVAALSSCHMLWYLHLCADSNIVVLNYEDDPIGIMIETPDGGGKFESVTLNPKVLINNPDQLQQALQLHQAAHAKCFIANSCNFPVSHIPVIDVPTNDATSSDAPDTEFSLSRIIPKFAFW